MRVFGDGAGFSRDGGFSGNRGSRADQFRRNRRAGETVRGKLLGFEASGLAWVRIEGQELLARVNANAQPGQIMRFLIVSLTPDIILKELPQDGGASSSRSLGALAGALSANKEAFEALLARSEFAQAGDLSPNIPLRRPPFLRWLAGNTEALRLYREIREACREASALLAPAGLGRYHYLPWILPRASGFEALIRRTRPSPKEGKSGSRRAPILWDVRCRFSLPDMGRVSLSILFSKSKARYKIALERPQAAGLFPELVKDLRLGKSRLDLELLGAGPLSRDDESDLLSLALMRTRQRFTGVNLQV